MNGKTGTMRTIGGIIVLSSIILKQFGVELEVSDTDITNVSEAIGSIILGYGVVVNIIKRIKGAIKK